MPRYLQKVRSLSRIFLRWFSLFFSSFLWSVVTVCPLFRCAFLCFSAPSCYRLFVWTFPGSLDCSFYFSLMFFGRCSSIPSYVRMFVSCISMLFLRSYVDFFLRFVLCVPLLHCPLPCTIDVSIRAVGLISAVLVRWLLLNPLRTSPT